MVDARDPRLVVVGEQHGQAVERALAELRLRVEREAGVHAVVDAQLEDAAAVVLAPPLQGASAERAVTQVRRAWPELPLFVATPGDAPDRDVARLYRRGATAVFAWPLEEKLFPAVLAEMLGAESRSATPDADRALRRAVRARLRALGRAEPGVRISVRSGRVRLSGSVARLWKARALANDVASVPGVRGVDTRDLVVEPSGLADREIARSLRMLLRGASSIDEHTLTVSVHDGHVVLMGTVLNREEWLHTLELFALAPGVRSVTNRTFVEPRRKRAGRALATRLETRVHAEVPDSEDVRVSVLGGVAVLQGRVPLLLTKRRVAEVVSREPAVTRVVDKLRTGSA